MIVEILFLLAMLFVLLFGISLFVPTIVELIINIPILYAIVLRTYVEVVEEKRYTEYLLGLLASFFFFLIKRDLFLGITTPYILWSPTIFLMVGFLTAQIIIMLNTLHQRHYRKGM